MKKRTRKKNHQPRPVSSLSLSDARLLTYAQAADKLGVSAYTLRQWVYQGRIDVVTFNHQVKRIRVEALERFIDDSTVEARV